LDENENTFFGFSASTMVELTPMDRERLDGVVQAVKSRLSDPNLRCQSQRAVQAHVWHFETSVNRMLTDLRRDQTLVRDRFMEVASSVIFKLHEVAIDTTLARAGITQDARVHAGSSLDVNADFDLICLDAKERLYLIMKSYDWLSEFFQVRASSSVS
jgi:hypothetical protein